MLAVGGGGGWKVEIAVNEIVVTRGYDSGQHGSGPACSDARGHMREGG